MKQDTGILSCIIKCESQEELRSVRQFVINEMEINSVYIDISRSYPNGIEVQKNRSYRIRDFFDTIEAIPSITDRSIRIIFHLRSGVDRYWKDVAARFLQSIKELGNVTVGLVTKSS
jgi:hypothetical protein